MSDEYTNMYMCTCVLVCACVCVYFQVHKLFAYNDSLPYYSPFETCRISLMKELCENDTVP